MSEISQNTNSSNDEIDLLDLFRRMGNTLGKWGKALGRGFLFSIVFLLKSWLPLGLSIIAGIVVSFLMQTTTESNYTADLVLKNNSSTTTELISYVNKLNSFDSLTLATALSLDPSKIDNIVSINAYWIIDKNKDNIPDFVDEKNTHNIYDTTDVRMQGRFDIRATIKAPQELSLIQNSIVTFIENDSLFQQRNRVRLKQNNELITRLDYDILQLDSLQKVKYFEETRNRQAQSGGQMVFLQEQNTQLIYNDIYNLYSRKQELEKERDLYKGVVTVLSDFSVPTIRDNGVKYYGTTYIPAFFVLTLLVLILLANRKKLQDIYKEYK